MERTNLKEIQKDELRPGDLVRLGIYGQVGLFRAMYLGEEHGVWRFLMFKVGKLPTTIKEIPPSGQWIIVKVWLESRNEKATF